MNPEIMARAVEAAAKAMSEHWRDMHTNESLGYQRMLAQHAVTAALAEVEASFKAEAWVEGYDAAAKQHPDASFLGARNPYKALRGESE